VSSNLHFFPQVRRINLYNMPAETGGGEFGAMLSVRRPTFRIPLFALPPEFCL
jgi:hypothetical protein